MRDWVTNVRDTFYIIGTVAGPDPYPRMVRDFNAVVGREARAQMLAEYGRLPDAVTACVGGGSNAIGMFHAFLNDRDVRIVGAEAAGEGIATGHHAASLAAGRPGVLHGNRTYVLCDDDGQIIETHSVSAGLDYPGVGPEHAFLKDTGRAEYVGVTDDEALAAFHLLARTEGILAALESSHAIAQAMKLARELPKDAHRAVQPVRPRRQGRAHHRRARRLVAVGFSLLPPAGEGARRADEGKRSVDAERLGFDRHPLRLVARPGHSVLPSPQPSPTSGRGGRNRLNRTHEPHRHPLRRTQGRRPQGPGPVHHRRRSVARSHRAGDARAGRGRRRRDRARRAVLRPDGRRSDHPAQLRTRARARRRAGVTCSTACARSASATPIRRWC